MKAIDKKALTTRMSKQLANYKLSDESITKLADRLLIDGLSLVKVYPCIAGICGDYFTNHHPDFGKVTPARGVSRWEVFPIGIIDWDMYRVRVEFPVDEMQGRVHVAELRN